MHAKIFSATTIGVDAHLVEVEVDIAFGLINFYIVGLPDTGIKESSKRISTALKNCGIRFPAKRITVNLAPADIKKEGSLFDLPIALGILQAAEYIKIDKDFLDETLFLGELSLDGSIRFIKGALAVAYDARKLGKKRVVVPKTNAQEASLIPDLDVIGADHLTELIAMLKGEAPLIPTKRTIIPQSQRERNIDFAQVKGQRQAKRALQIAAAGRHNILFVGSPGSGKTMLAKRLASIMPPMAYEEMLQTSKIYSISGKLQKTPLIKERPFRNPHHSISQAGLIGGGSYPQPGEMSLAHNGILFLDELTEFKRDTLEALRQPIENKTVSIARVHQSIQFPASVLLIAALNPCPCGFYGDKKRQCSCSQLQIQRYLSKLSGPLLDRIDLQIHVPSLAYDSIQNESYEQSQTSQALYTSVEKAVTMQQNRFDSHLHYNNTMTTEQIEIYCKLTEDAEELVKKVFDKLHLSMRGYHKLLKVARTIADLDEKETIEFAHIKEACMYRSLDHYLDRQR